MLNVLGASNARITALADALDNNAAHVLSVNVMSAFHKRKGEGMFQTCRLKRPLFV